MGWQASVYVRDLEVAPDGSRVGWDLKPFLLLAATYYDERRRVLRTDVPTLAEKAGLSRRRIFGLFATAVNNGILERIPTKRGEAAEYRFAKRFSEIHDTQNDAPSETSDTEPAPPVQPMTLASEMGDTQPPVSVKPMTLASETHDTQLGTNQARLPRGIPKGTLTEEPTEKKAAPKRRRAPRPEPSVSGEYVERKPVELAGVLTPQEVAEEINAALHHKSARNWDDTELYVSRWLGREVRARQARASTKPRGQPPPRKPDRKPEDYLSGPYAHIIKH